MSRASWEMTALVGLVSEFARPMTEHRGTDLDPWAAHVRAARLAEMELFLNGLDQTATPPWPA